MANDRTTGPYVPKRYRHRPTLVEGIIYDGELECARAIVEWGRARTGNLPFNLEGDDLHAYTRQGQRYVPDGDMATLGVLLEPYSIQPDVREIAYVEVGLDYGAPLTVQRVRELVAEARQISDRGRLREIVAQLGANSEALTA